MKFIGLLVAIVATAAVAQQKAQDRTVMITSSDRAMESAIRQAKETLDDFLKVVAAPPKGASGFKVKVRIDDSGETEHIWVTPFRRTKDGFEGIISNEPELVHSVKYGQMYRFTRASITDWGYELNGKQKGSFTVCVMFTQMPKAEADSYRKDYGFEC